MTRISSGTLYFLSSTLTNFGTIIDPRLELYFMSALSLVVNNALVKSRFL